MTTIETATQWMIDLANDNSHGYTQVEENRWGPDYDCSSAIITAWETAGVPVKTMGNATYTGNMRDAFLLCGFSDITDSVNLDTKAGFAVGDVLLKLKISDEKEGHTAMYIGEGAVVHARTDENSAGTGWQTGDQEGNEIMTSTYENDPTHPWQYVLRYTFDGNLIVRDGQIHANNFIGAGLVLDGHRGPAAITAGIKVLQHALNLDYNAGLTVDGSFGPLTQAALGSHYVMVGETQYLVTAAQILLMLHGVDPHGVESPGHFGSGMLSAVTAFQIVNNLPATGICNNATFIKLIQ